MSKEQKGTEQDSDDRAPDVCVESRRWGIGRVGAQLIELTLGASQPELLDRQV